jgi:hypothetical protein
MHVELCPVCKGSGVIQLLPTNDFTNAQPSTKPCHACDGRGYLYVPDASDYWKPYVPPYQPDNPYYPDRWTVTWDVIYHKDAKSQSFDVNTCTFYYNNNSKRVELHCTS